MSLVHLCDFPACMKEATVKIIEHRYDDPSFEQSLDACDEHRTVTHAGWWCRDAERLVDGGTVCTCPTLQGYHDPRCPQWHGARRDAVPDFGLQPAYTEWPRKAAGR